MSAEIIKTDNIFKNFPDDDYFLVDSGPNKNLISHTVLIFLELTEFLLRGSHSKRSLEVSNFFRFLDK